MTSTGHYRHLTEATGRGFARIGLCLMRNRFFLYDRRYSLTAILAINPNK